MMRAVKNRVSIPELVDICQMPVGELISHLKKIETKYGKKTTITFNAGFNNIDCWIDPSKKEKK